MHCPTGLRRLLLSLVTLTAGCAVASAADLACMKYVPAADKSVSVPCAELKPSSPAAAVTPAPPPAASPAPVAAPPTPKVAATTTYDVTPLKEKLSAMTKALTEAKADTPFRETFCALKATAQLLHQRKDDKREVTRLTNEHIDLEAKVGERGKWVNTSLYQEVMDMVLGTPVDDAIPSTQLRQTPEGQAFVKARDGLRFSCNCMYEEVAPKRMFCCDGCSQDALKARF